MKKTLIVIDMQKDFIDGALGTKEAQAIINNAAQVIKEHNGEIIVTYDTHFEDYLNTLEGAKLPVTHCVKNTNGWKLNEKIEAALQNKEYTKER